MQRKHLQNDLCVTSYKANTALQDAAGVTKTWDALSVAATSWWAMKKKMCQMFIDYWGVGGRESIFTMSSWNKKDVQ